MTEHAVTFIDDLNATPDPRIVYVSVDELNWWKPEDGMLTKYRTPEYISFRKREYAKMLEEISHAQSFGVRLLAGTDDHRLGRAGLPGLSLPFRAPA